MANRRYPAALLLLLPALTAAQTDTRVDFGHLSNGGAVAVGETLARQRLRLTLPCTGPCDPDGISLLPRGEVLSQDAPRRRYRLGSPIAGLAIDIALETAPLGADALQLEAEIALIKRGGRTEGGEISLHTPLVSLMETRDGRRQKAGDIYISGTLELAACEVVSNALTFHLPSLPYVALRSSPLARPVEEGKSQRTLLLRCDGGVSTELTMTFSALNAATPPWLLPAQEDAAVGFMVKEGLSDSWVQWNSERYSLALTVPESGTLEVPFTAYYVRLGERPHSGSVSAKGQYTVVYR
ncbi:fimbrial protein [Edwardsiella piscicida]